MVAPHVLTSNLDLWPSVPLAPQVLALFMYHASLNTLNSYLSLLSSCLPRSGPPMPLGGVNPEHPKVLWLWGASADQARPPRPYLSQLVPQPIPFQTTILILTKTIGAQRVSPTFNHILTWPAFIIPMTHWPALVVQIILPWLILHHTVGLCHTSYLHSDHIPSPATMHLTILPPSMDHHPYYINPMYCSIVSPVKISCYLPSSRASCSCKRTQVNS